MQTEKRNLAIIYANGMTIFMENSKDFTHKHIHKPGSNKPIHKSSSAESFICNAAAFFFYLFGQWADPAVFRDKSWLCNEE